MANGSHEATFWHGPGHRQDPQKSTPYLSAMQDYVNLIHIPAARIIRKYHAYVVYGGWPDQGGLNNYFAWLEDPLKAQGLMDRQLQCCWPTHLKRMLDQNYPLHRETKQRARRNGAGDRSGRPDGG